MIALFRRSGYHTKSLGAMFAHLGRFRVDSAVEWDDAASNPLPLSVAILYRAYRSALSGNPCPGVPQGSTGCNPAVLLYEMRRLWAGDPRCLPRCTSYTRSFPYLFNLEYGIQGGVNEGGHLRRAHRALLAVSLSPQALALVSAPVIKGSEVAALERDRKRMLRDQGLWSNKALILLSSTPLYWLPRLTARPCADSWGPIIHEILEKEGSGDAKRMLMEPLLLSIGKEAIRRGLPLPPNNVSWFSLSAHPAYSRFRVLWEEQLLNSGAKVGARMSNRGPMALELVPEGQTFLQECLGTLKMMASHVKENKNK